MRSRNRYSRIFGSLAIQISHDLWTGRYGNIQDDQFIVFCQKRVISAYGDINRLIRRRYRIIKYIARQGGV